MDLDEVNLKKSIPGNTRRTEDLLSMKIVCGISRFRDNSDCPGEINAYSRIHRKTSLLKVQYIQEMIRFGKTK